MNESQDGVRNGLSVGVLIIGSLYWDLASDRKEWRASRLNAGGARTVRAPIRYGRQSSTRGCSYTMVFSSDLREDPSGRAIIVPCKHHAYSIDDLNVEAECLWAAERQQDATRRGISAGWGCVALLVNPNRTDSVKGGAKLDHRGGGKLDHSAVGWSGGTRQCGGDVRTPGWPRAGGLSCCVRGESSRRSAPGCGRGGSVDRAARRSAVRTRRSRFIR